MKWTAVTLDVSKYRKMGQELGIYFRVISALITGCILFFVALGLLGYMQSRMSDMAPSSSMKTMASTVSSQFFMDMLGMELPHMETDRQSFTFSQSNVSGFLFTLLTDLSWKEPKTFIARELPGLAYDRSVVLRKSSSTGDDAPEDYGPKGDVIPKNGEGGEGSITANPTAPPETGETGEVVPDPPAATANPPKTAGKNVAFIYQTHNQESYLPELPGVKDPDKAYHPKTNVTQVGLRLAQRLEKEGIGAVHSDRNYPAIEKNFYYAYSYKYSHKTLQEASASHPDLKFYFDIHRDSQRRQKTTVTIGGKDYAQVYFIIGGKNAGWKENEQFASEIHQALERKYPGLSKGTFAKAGEGNGVYNQNFSSNSVLIEVGGVDNSLEECYRTADVLAQAIAEVVLNAQKVDAQPAPASEPADSSADKSADKPTDKPADVPAIKSTDKPADVPADKSTDKSADKSADNQAGTKQN
ncbi:stage II sporulation protein P [Paenibacillus xerothermodurans]|uniref:Stage II sporulation protein P n=1 Tax=Paenibacillus xerothermodurans TaxID=1977292 RepID=A0A2W1NGB9_PAEXE|nr:stage II sporulation protein P [Paenibacillus xerothermodurans]PZE22730.1 stage II sporulation protein P [Paenibacillus xerothermodurans]